MIKRKKNSKIKTWQFYAYNGEFIAELSFYTEEVKALFPGAKIVKNKVQLP